MAPTSSHTSAPVWRQRLVGRAGGEHEQADLVGRPSGALQRVGDRVGRERRGGLAAGSAHRRSAMPDRERIHSSLVS